MRNFEFGADFKRFIFTFTYTFYARRHLCEGHSWKKHHIRLQNMHNALEGVAFDRKGLKTRWNAIWVQFHVLR